MNYELMPLLTGPVVVGILVAHVALVIASWKVNPLYLIAAAFLVLVVVSSAPGFPGYIFAKYARVYATILLVVIGILRFRVGPLRPAAKALMALAALYLIAALWSPSPLWGLAGKSFFGWAVLAGVFLAYEIRDADELMRRLRFFAVVVAIGAWITFSAASMRYGRLALEGSSANILGGNLAMGLLICSFLGLYGRATIWRIFGLVNAGLFGVLIIWTGSRSALLTIMAGLLVQILPATKRRFSMLLLIVLVTIVPYFVLSQLGATYSMQRAITMRDNRTTEWLRAIEVVKESPYFGHGWISHGSWKPEGIRFHNAHSVYFQALMDTGLLGLAVFTVCSLIIVVRAYQMYQLVRHRSSHPHLATLPLSILAAVLVNSAAVGSTLTGNVSGTLFLGFSVGLIDRLPELMVQERVRTLWNLRVLRSMRWPWSGLTTARHIAGK